jgi:hypothetical protein
VPYSEHGERDELEQQAETFMTEIASRKSDPVRSNTLHVYRSLLDARILPTIGKEDLASVNKTAKLLVGRLTEVHLSPSTIGLAVTHSDSSHSQPITATKGDTLALVALLAGTGLRIGLGFTV